MLRPFPSSTLLITQKSISCAYSSETRSEILSIIDISVDEILGPKESGRNIKIIASLSSSTVFNIESSTPKEVVPIPIVSSNTIFPASGYGNLHLISADFTPKYFQYFVSKLSCLY